MVVEPDCGGRSLMTLIGADMGRAYDGVSVLSVTPATSGDPALLATR